MERAYVTVDGAVSGAAAGRGVFMWTKFDGRKRYVIYSSKNRTSLVKYVRDERPWIGNDDDDDNYNIITVLTIGFRRTRVT